MASAFDEHAERYFGAATLARCRPSSLGMLQIYAAVLHATGGRALHEKEGREFPIFRCYASGVRDGLTTISLNDDSATVVAQKLTYQGANILPATKTERLSVPCRQLSRLQHQLHGCDFWHMSMDGGTHPGLDGQSVFIEARHKDQYNLVYRWSPEEKSFVKLFRTFARLYHRTLNQNRPWWQAMVDWAR